MKNVSMEELITGDIFCHELKLHNREAFKVTEKDKNSITYASRIDGRERRNLLKTVNGDQVILLRHEPA